MRVTSRQPPEFMFRQSPEWSVPALPDHIRRSLLFWEIAGLGSSDHFAEESRLLHSLDSVLAALVSTVSTDYGLLVWVEGAFLANELTSCIAAVCGRVDSPPYYVPPVEKSVAERAYNTSWFSFVVDPASAAALSQCGADWNDIYLYGGIVRKERISEFMRLALDELPPLSELLRDTTLLFMTTKHVAELEVLGLDSVSQAAIEKIKRL